MKKVLLLLSVVLFGTTMAFAQDEDEVTPKGKPTVFMESFTATSSTRYGTSIRNAIIAAIAKVNRIEMMDAESEAVAANEDLRRTSGNISAGDGDATERLGAVVRLGAQLYLKGNIDALSSATQTNSSGKKQSDATLLVTLKLINPNDGSLISTKQMKFTDTEYEDNQEKAIQGVITSIGNTLTVEQTVDEFFPIEGQLIDINEAKKDDAKSVYINAGSLHGVSNKLKFEVFTTKTIAGRTARKKIGELRVKEIQGDDITLCTVKSGGKDIFAAFQAGEKIIVKSRPDQSLIGVRF